MDNVSKNQIELTARQPFDFISPTTSETVLFNGRPMQVDRPHQRFWEGPQVERMISFGEPR